MLLGGVWVFTLRIILIDLILKFGTDVQVRQDAEEDTCQRDGCSIRACDDSQNAVINQLSRRRRFLVREILVVLRIVLELALTVLTIRIRGRTR